MLYTGRGDKGTTKLFGCDDRVAKSDPRIEALGELDELNCHIGLCGAHAAANCPELLKPLRDMQERLFIIQAAVAGAPQKLDEKALPELESFIAYVETQIDPITAFIIPGATVLSGELDVARTVARRTERKVVALKDASLDSLIPYLNRLSSALFAAARLVSKRAGANEYNPHY